MEKEKRNDIQLKGATIDVIVESKRSDRITEVPVHEMTDPPLTVPDLEDSIAAMLARRIAGVKTEFNSLGNRNYPIDPNSLTQALDIVKNYNANLQTRLENQEKNIATTVESERVRKEREKQEKKEFEEFRRKQILLIENK